ncbi:MAG: FAD-dependent oxidoreductase, partial [Bacteroidota bacterium]|nr:FAD-dependent oxidoreductase [Bacteroidota bacterium]
MEQTNRASYDVVVLGAGPGGYVAAVRAAQLGRKTACIEARHLGGICLNWGCIPTKSLLKAAEAWETVKKAGEYGITLENPAFDFARIVQRSRLAADRMSKGVAFLFKKNGVEHIPGTGRLLETPDRDPVVVGVFDEKGTLSRTL